MKKGKNNHTISWLGFVQDRLLYGRISSSFWLKSQRNFQQTNISKLRKQHTQSSGLIWPVVGKRGELKNAIRSKTHNMADSFRDFSRRVVCDGRRRADADPKPNRIRRSPLSLFGWTMFLVSQCRRENWTKRNVRSPLLSRGAAKSTLEVYSVLSLQTDFKCRIT